MRVGAVGDLVTAVVARLDRVVAQVENLHLHLCGLLWFVVCFGLESRRTIHFRLMVYEPHDGSLLFFFVINPQPRVE